MKNRFYKKYNELYIGYVLDFHNYLVKNATEYFNNPDNKATDMRDFELWSDSPCDREHLVMYGEIMLVDLETEECDHAYVICQVTRGFHRLSSGRRVQLKPLQTVIPIDTIRKSVWKNGYFLLPKVFNLTQ